MLKPDMVNQLNAQLNLEFYSSNLYLQMSAWCADKGYEGAAAFLKAHAAEEMEHMQRLFNYLSDTGAMPLYVAEQHEEEKLFKSVLDKFAMVGDSGKSLFLLDKDLGRMASEPSAS